MLRLLTRKLVQGIFLILISSAITFALLANAGGDALSALQDNPQVSRETLDNLRRVYGLDRPMIERYAIWLGSAVRGDLGNSLYFRTPVASLVATRFGSTLLVSLAAIAISLSISVLLAFAAVRFRWRWLAAVNDFVVLLSASTPRLVLSLIALTILVQLSLTETFIAAAVVLAIPLISLFLAQLVDGLDDAMKQDYIRLARAKGLSENIVILRHASRAVLNPVLTLIGLCLGALLAGSVLVETILGRQGMGSLMVAAVRNRDIPLVMGIVLVASAAVWLANSLAEVMQMVNDKRLRDAEAK
jgi:ABC-type dipeptide/oligopeptide/nickel transport system permease component